MHLAAPEVAEWGALVSGRLRRLDGASAGVAVPAASACCPVLRGARLFLTTSSRWSQ